MTDTAVSTAPLVHLVHRQKRMVGRAERLRAAQLENETILARLQAGDRGRLATLPDDALPAGALAETCARCREPLLLIGRTLLTPISLRLSFVCPECGGKVVVRDHTMEEPDGPGDSSYAD